MLILHPITQLTATLLALYVLFLGVQRFRWLHLQQKKLFRWQRHVWLGTIVLLLWFLGIVGGLILVKTYWHGLLITGWHGYRLFVFLPLILFGLVSGWVMHKNKKKRVILPLIHGSSNVLLIILALLQGLSGWQVYNSFVLGN